VSWPVTDFVVSAKLVADASSLKAGAAEGKKAIDDLGGSAAKAAPSANALKTAIEAINQAAHPATGSTQQLKAAVAEAKAQFDAGALSANGYARVLLVSTRASREFAKATSGMGQSLAGARASSANLGAQIGDVTQQLALGQNPAMVFGQQINQIAFAAQNMGGKLGAVATFLATGWGAVITGRGHGRRAACRQPHQDRQRRRRGREENRHSQDVPSRPDNRDQR
jgi:hypothetical protein